MMDRLKSLRLLVLTGKGGVGKSTLTAGLAALLASHGRRTLMLEVDPRESIHRLFDAPPSGGDIVEVGSRLWLQNLRPRDAIDRVVRDRMPFEMLARRVLASPIYDHFVNGCPGLDELAVLGHCLEVAERRIQSAPPIDIIPFLYHRQNRPKS